VSLPRVVRVLLAVTVCPLLGAMLGRAYGLPLLGQAGSEAWVWGAGVVVGLLYAAAVISLAFGSHGRGGRVMGDLVLLALCLLAATELAVEITGATVPHFRDALLAAYLLGFLVSLRGLRPQPPAGGLPERRPGPREYDEW
jgi:hypothetical protein